MELIIKLLDQSINNYNTWCDLVTLPSHKKVIEEKAIQAECPTWHLSDYAKEVMNAK